MKYRDEQGANLTPSDVDANFRELVLAISEKLANPMTTAGDLIVGGAAGAPLRLGIGAANKVLGVNSAGTGLEWQTPAAGGGGGEYLTRENFIEQVWNGALGIQSPIAIFARDNVGAYIFSADDGALKAMLPWLTTTLVKGLVAVGPYIFRGDNVAGIVVDSNSLVALSTGAAAGFGSSAELFASALISNAAELADSSFVMAPVRPAALSNSTQQYNLDVTFSLPPFGSVSFRYGYDYSESVWSVWWMDATNNDQSFVTSRAMSTSGMSYPRIEISGSNMVCKEGATIIHTIPLANIYKDESTASSFGVVVNLYKVTGNTPILIGLGTPSGRLVLNPA